MTDTPTERAAESTWTRLRRRKVVQWGVAYAAGAWLLMQVLEYFSGTFDWPRQLQQLSTLALLIGLPIVLVLAWYHGDRGEQRIRGTELSIVALLLLLGGGIVWYYQHALETSTVATPAAPSAPAIPTDASIAVLPFVNMSGNPADEYFSDGLAEELLNSLARIEGLKVAARTASFQYKDRTGDVAEIARQLKVAHVLEGSVRRSGSRVRITAQLIKAADGYHLWSESYDRELEDIFGVQSDIAGRIAEKLRVELVARPTTGDLEAFDLLLQARHLMRQRNASALLEARKLLEQAVTKDPGYAAAWSALAAVLNLLPTYASVDTAGTYQRAEEAARQATKLDPAMAEPLSVRAQLNELRRNWIEADRLFERALAIEPDDPNSQYWRAYNLSRAGYLSESRAHLDRALALEPTNAALYVWLAFQLAARGQYAPALTALKKAEDLGTLEYAYNLGGLIRVAQGDGPGAIERWNLYFERRGIRTQAPQLVVEALRDPRRRPAALAAIDELPPDEFGFHTSVVLGDADRALKIVERSSRGTDVMDNVIWWDLARPVRQTAEFRRLVGAVGLEKLWRARGWPDKCRPKGASDFVCD